MKKGKFVLFFPKDKNITKRSLPREGKISFWMTKTFFTHLFKKLLSRFNDSLHVRYTENNHYPIK